MIALWLEMVMPATLTLKNIPDDVHERLKALADLHRRSVSDEAIVVLKSALAPAKLTPPERLARARALRESFGRTRFRARDIDAMKREGRS